MRYAGKKFLVVGLGSSGVSAARYLLAEGAEVHVTDATRLPSRDAELSDKITSNNKFYGQLHTSFPVKTYEAGVVSPGVPLSDPFIQSLQAAGVAVIGDIELFARAANAPVIGITGSNGKSTVTTLVGEMARAAGLRVGVGGNLGTPALDLLKPDAQLYVLELSSFQLETTQSLRCKAATILNISQDHLDRHGTMQNYADAKAIIFKGCEQAVVNRDDAEVMQRAPRQALSFGLGAPPPDGYGILSPLPPGEAGAQRRVRDEGDDTDELQIEHRPSSGASRHLLPMGEGTAWLARGEAPVISTQQLNIFGTHNWANALAALALADAAAIPRVASLKALQEFRGLPHRCEFVAELGGVRYFNDSKGTNVGSTAAALKGLPAPIVWLAGGQGKGQSFSELREVLAQKGRAAILFGEDAGKIEQDIFGALPVYREADMFKALSRARGLAVSGDAVLLSPACASFDQFKNYLERGSQFAAQVRGWLQ